MKRFESLAFAAILLSTALPAWAASLEQLAWMRGTWTQVKDGEIVQEAWIGPRGGMITGVNLTTSAKSSSFEFLRIVEKEGALSYLASPGGQTPTEFKLKELADKRVVFENAAHDFPQRILYWIESDGTMKARIEGTVQGKARGMEWRFTSAKP
jgi:hypothetical protein